MELSAKTRGIIGKAQQMLVNGEWINAEGPEAIDVVNPANGQIITTTPIANESDVDKAVASSRRAFNTLWKDFAPAKRGELIWKLADLLERDKQTLMELESIDNGKPLNKAEYDVNAAINHFRYYAGLASKIEGRQIPVSSPNKVVYAKREALGVVGIIVPWNFPLMMAAWKLAPALACGNCCIIKPAEQTPLTTIYLGKLALEAGFPAGVLNVITGTGLPTGQAMSAHMDIDKIGFTGSTEVGKKIMASAAQSNLKKVSLELGGKSPNIIFDDADLSKVYQSVLWSSFYNTGQECTLGSRIFVHENIIDQVIEQLSTQAAKLSIGEGLTSPDLGPVISAEQLETVQGYIEAGKSEAELIRGGNRLGGDLAEGYFLEPTIFRHQNDGIKIVKEEIFGPVVAVSSFKTEEEIVSRANDSIYGLASGVWTQDISKAHRMANAIQAGTVWINGYDMFDPAVPFGGYKQSGFGREMGQSAIELYTQEKSVWIAL